MITTAGWRVHPATAATTCFRLFCLQHEGGPWPLARALADLAGLGVRPSERFRSLGAGRGHPLLHSQECSWEGITIHLEARAGGEAALELPAGDELVGSVDEDSLWRLVDVFAAAVDARHGALTDGEAADPALPESDAAWRRRLRHHLGVLIPAYAGVEWGAEAAPYRLLERSRLLVVLR